MLFHAYKLRNHTISLFYMETIVSELDINMRNSDLRERFTNVQKVGILVQSPGCFRDSRFYLFSMVSEVDLFNYIHGFLNHDQFYHDCMKISCGLLYVKKRAEYLAGSNNFIQSGHLKQSSRASILTTGNFSRYIGGRGHISQLFFPAPLILCLVNNVLHSHHFSVTFCHQQKPGRLVSKFLISPKTLFFCRWRRVLFT